MDLDNQKHRAVFKLEVISYLRTRFYRPYSTPVSEIYNLWDGLQENAMEEVLIQMDGDTDCPLNYNQRSNQVNVDSTAEADRYIDEIKVQTPYYD